MSNSPYGPPPPGGQPPQQPPGGSQPPSYGQQPAYGQMPGQQGQYGAGMPQLASWGQRVGAYLIDWVIALPAGILVGIGYFMMIGEAVENTQVNPDTGALESTGEPGGVSAVGVILVLVGIVLGIVIQAWNRWYKGGKGQSIGKKTMGITLLGEGSRQPIGGLSAFIRDIAHFLDGLICYIGYLWPLWDDKRQTFADKIMSTIVVQGTPPNGPR